MNSAMLIPLSISHITIMISINNFIFPSRKVQRSSRKWESPMRMSLEWRVSCYQPPHIFRIKSTTIPIVKDVVITTISTSVTIRIIAKTFAYMSVIIPHFLPYPNHTAWCVVMCNQQNLNRHTECHSVLQNNTFDIVFYCNNSWFAREPLVVVCSFLILQFCQPFQIIIYSPMKTFFTAIQIICSPCNQIS